jgi:hypothetical protein
VSLLRQADKNRYVAHLLYSPALQRGEVKVIEDFPPIPGVKLAVRVPRTRHEGPHHSRRRNAAVRPRRRGAHRRRADLHHAHRNRVGVSTHAMKIPYHQLLATISTFLPTVVAAERVGAGAGRVAAVKSTIP